MKRLGIILVLSCIATMLVGQNRVRFSAKTNAKQIVKGGVVEAVFSLENGEGEGFKPPTFKGFQVISGPSTMVNKTFINGRLSQSYSFAYRLKATKTGVLTIEKATIKVGNKIYSTKPIKVDVVKQSPKSTLGIEDVVYIKPELDVETAYVGQQVLVKFKLYSNKEILRTDIYSSPSFSGTFAQPINFFRLNDNIEVINGKQFIVRVLGQYAIFPQKEGTITIDELSAYVKLMDLTGGFSRVVDEELVSKTATLEVKPLENKPEDFTGGVGQFQFKSILTKNKLSTDESTTLTLDILGTGDVKAIQVPVLEALKPYFEIYDPAVNSQLAEQNDRIVGQKIMTFQLVPKKVGRFNYTPTFTYYDTDEEKFVTLKGDSLDIIITKGSGVIQDESEDFTDDGVRDIKTILGTTTFGGKPDFFGTPLFWILLTLPFVGLLVAILIKKKRKNEAEKDPTLVKMSNADKVALQRLTKAQTHLKQKEQRAFYDEISKALWGYVSDKLVINRAELSKQNIRSKLAAKKVDKTQIDNFIEILNTCEMAIFAGIGGDESEMQNIYNKAKQVISEIEK